MKDEDEWRRRRGRVGLWEKRICYYCPLLLHYVTFSPSPSRLLAFYSCLVSHSCSHSLPRRLSICEGPASLLSKKSHCSANTKATHTMSHTQACTRLLATHSCVERERLFFHDWVLTLSSELVPLESWARQINSVNGSLWFCCQTLLAHSLSPCTSDCVIVTSLFWRQDELIAVTVLTSTVTICASQDISIAARSPWPLASFIALTFVLKTIIQSGQI